MLSATIGNKPKYLNRMDGRVERICEHGVGHTVYAPEGSDYIHGCDGCCKGYKEEYERTKK